MIDLASSLGGESSGGAAACCVAFRYFLFTEKDWVGIALKSPSSQENNSRTCSFLHGRMTLTRIGQYVNSTTFERVSLVKKTNHIDTLHQTGQNLLLHKSLGLSTFLKMI